MLCMYVCMDTLSLSWLRIRPGGCQDRGEEVTRAETKRNDSPHGQTIGRTDSGRGGGPLAPQLSTCNCAAGYDALLLTIHRCVLYSPSLRFFPWLMDRLCSLVERRKLWPLPPWAPRFDTAKEYTVFGIDICV